MPNFFIEELRTVLSPESFVKLESKMILIGDDSPHIVEDRAGSSFNYEFQGSSIIKPDVRAFEWLGIEPDYYD